MKWFGFFLIGLVYLLTRLESLTLDMINDPRHEWMDELVESYFSDIQGEISCKKVRAIYAARNRSLLKKMFEKDMSLYVVRGKRVMCTGKGNYLPMFKELVETVDLGNCEMLVHEHDGIIHPGQLPSLDVPVFASTRHRAFSNVLPIVDYFYKKTCHGPYDWNHVFHTIKKLNMKISWNDKHKVAFWRGTNSSLLDRYTKSNWKQIPRGKLVALSLDYPQLINARFTSILKGNLGGDGEHDYLPVSSRVGYNEQLNYRYLVCVNGVTCTFPGVRWRLLSNSAMLFQESPFSQWFYPLMKPWVHYIPLKEDLSDLPERVIWAQNNDDKVKEIAQQATQLVEQKLTPHHCKIFTAKMLIRYASLYSLNN